MTAEGYKASPLSDELERRIRDRIRATNIDAIKTGPAFDYMVKHAHISALEWVLQEAEAIAKHEPKPPAVAGPRIVRQEQPRWDSTCHSCGHVHQDEEQCGVKMGGAGPCQCTTKVTA